MDDEVAELRASAVRAWGPALREGPMPLGEVHEWTEAEWAMVAERLNYLARRARPGVTFWCSTAEVRRRG